MKTKQTARDWLADLRQRPLCADRISLSADLSAVAQRAEEEAKAKVTQGSIPAEESAVKK